MSFFSFSVVCKPHLPLTTPYGELSARTLTQVFDGVHIGSHGASSAVALLDLLGRGLLELGLIGDRVDLGEWGCVCHDEAVGGLEQWKSFGKLEACSRDESARIEEAGTARRGRTRSNKGARGR
jgi:hypothetical protein